jgi:hypothetical protein
VSKRVFRGIRESGEVKIRRESRGKSSRRRIPEVFIKQIREQDSFQREVNNSKPSDPEELRRGWP